MFKILVTGGAGFIGSHICENLVKNGNKVICADNFDEFYSFKIKEDNIRNVKKNKLFNLFKVNINDNHEVLKLFKSNEIDFVIHLAAKAGVRPSILSPQEYYQTNVMGTLNILEAMKVTKVKKMIFASSSSIYGNNKKTPFCETDFVDSPISPYAASKKSAELLCHTYHHLYNYDIFCLRFFTVYGPRQRPDLAIHKFTKSIFEGKEIPFYGTGNSMRDYTHIYDIINAINNSINKLKGYEIINIGESKTTSLSELLTILQEYINKKAIINKLPSQPGDVNITFADISKARKMLNYNPTVDIEKGLKDFVDWYKEKVLLDSSKTTNITSFNEVPG